jgi:hypothetical protein
MTRYLEVIPLSFNSTCLESRSETSPHGPAIRLATDCGASLSCATSRTQLNPRLEFAAQAPTEHQQSAGDDPAADDPHRNARPCHSQLHDESGGQSDQNEHGEHES